MLEPLDPELEPFDPEQSMAAMLREHAERVENVVEEWLDAAQHYDMAQELRSIARGLRQLSEATLAEHRREAALRHRE